MFVSTEYNSTHLIDSILNSLDKPSRLSKKFAADVVETEEGYELLADFPGIKPEDVSLNIEDGILTIEAQRVLEKKESHTYTLERFYGTYKRSFKLPNNINVDAIQANFEHGQLSIKLPKLENNNVRRIPITVNAN